MNCISKKVLIIFIIMLSTLFGYSQYSNTQEYPVYTGNDLGLNYSPSSSTFKLWAPSAEKAEIIFYKSSLGDDEIETYEMTRESHGTWVKRMDRDLKGVYYVFHVFIDGKWSNQVPDPYAKAVGTNGKRAMVVDLKDTNPENWENDYSPAFAKRAYMMKGIGGLPTDAIVYELHVRDASISATSGIKNKGKFLGLSESGTKSDEGLSTGLDHLKELGVTHIHLLPSYDFYSIDESLPDSTQYNWGYDPLNYNTPEGSYSTNPENGNTRIKEFKTVIAAMHDKGLRVVMDVVYNHTMLTESSNFNQLVPGYYFRQKEGGGFSNASACGNETASERPMMRKFIIESLVYWVKEFHIDGFRFDLMGIHDIETMNEISATLHSIKPDILLYGEGWTAGSSPIPDSLRAIKKNVAQLNDIAVFSDDMRDGIKGSVFEAQDRGFVSGKTTASESVKFGITAACWHPQIEYSLINYSKQPYATSPSQVISYCECHDNNVLWDKLSISNELASPESIIEMHKLALSIVLTSQGISFLHAGSEFLRTKKGVENSFKSADSINAIDWALKSKNRDVYSYVKGLIAMRKDHPAFRLTTKEEIASLIEFIPQQVDGVISYSIHGAKVQDDWKHIFIVLNGSSHEQRIQLPEGRWNIYSSNNKLNESIPSVKESTLIHPFSASIFYKE
jgi:pullulanase